MFYGALKTPCPTKRPNTVLLKNSRFYGIYCKGKLMFPESRLRGEIGFFCFLEFVFVEPTFYKEKIYVNTQRDCDNGRRRQDSFGIRPLGRVS